jgi:hypothetical protein
MAYVCDCGQALWALLYRRALGAVGARRRSRRCLRGWFRHLQRIQVIMPRLLDTTMIWSGGWGHRHLPAQD